MGGTMVADGKVYVTGASTNTILALDQETGVPGVAVLARHPRGSKNMPGDGYTGAYTATNAPRWVNGVVYASFTNGVVYALDGDTGAQAVAVGGPGPRRPQGGHRPHPARRRRVGLLQPRAPREPAAPRGRAVHRRLPEVPLGGGRVPRPGPRRDPRRPPVLDRRQERDHDLAPLRRRARLARRVQLPGQRGRRPDPEPGTSHPAVRGPTRVRGAWTSTCSCPPRTAS